MAGAGPALMGSLFFVYVSSTHPPFTPTPMGGDAGAGSGEADADSRRPKSLSA